MAEEYEDDFEPETPVPVQAGEEKKFGGGDHPERKRSTMTAGDSGKQSVTPPQRLVAASSMTGEMKHRYRMSVDLRSIRGLDSTLNVFLRYVHPLLGVAGPVMTHPPVEVPKQTECLLPNSFNAFEFLAGEAELANAAPLVVEVFHKDKFMRDIEIGIVKVGINSLLSAPLFTAALPSSSGMHVSDNYCTLYNLERASRGGQKGGRIVPRGSVRVVLSLEDFGKTNEAAPAALPVQPDPAQGGQARMHQKAEDPRAGLDYQVAWELELWRRSEQTRFEAHLRERETARMAELEAEWKRRELQREEEHAARERDACLLEKKLKDALFDVEKQEQRVKASSEELARSEETLRRDFEQQKHEVVLSVRRQREQHKHHSHLLKETIADLKKHNEVLKTQLQASREKNRTVVHEFVEYKTANNKSHNGQLRAEVATLRKDMASLEDRLEEAERNHDTTKEHLARSLQEVERLRALNTEQERERLEAERSRLAALRAQYMASEQQHNIRRDRAQLQGIKDTLTRLMSTSPAPRAASTAWAAPAGTLQAPSSFSAGPASVPTGLGSAPRVLVHGPDPSRNANRGFVKSPRRGFTQASFEPDVPEPSPAPVPAIRPQTPNRVHARPSARTPRTHPRTPKARTPRSVRRQARSPTPRSERRKARSPSRPGFDGAAKARLLTQRAALLSSGMYNAEDPLVQELDRQIQAVETAA